MSDANETIPLTLEIPLLEELLPDSNFTDLVFLNVKENLEEGKITTWFKYAVTAIRTNTHLNKNIDYVVKADSDTLLYTDEFFEAAKMYLPRNPVRVYAGASWHWTEHPLEEIRNATTQFQARGILLHPYILGGLEILSIDLAKYVTSSQLNHTLITDLIGKAEDTLLGELVWSHPQNITLVALNNLPKNGLIWAHQRNTKDPANLRLLWLEYKNRHSNYLN